MDYVELAVNLFFGAGGVWFVFKDKEVLGFRY